MKYTRSPRDAANRGFARIKNKLLNLPPADIREILVVRYSSMGDIVLCTPIIRALKSKYPGSKILFLTKPEYAHLQEANPYIDEILMLDPSYAQTLAFLKSRNIDVIVDLHRNIRTRRLKSALKKARYYTFKKLNTKKWLLVNLKIDTLPDKSIVDRYFDGMKKLGIKNDEQGLDYFIPQGKGIRPSVDLPMSHQAGYVVGVIGGTYNTKKMPIEKWKELCEMTKYPIIIIGGPEEREFGDYLQNTVTDKKVYSACGKFNLHESADIIRGARAVIAHDTGMMHVAAAFQKPIITLWGSTVPAFGMFPYMPQRPAAYTSSEVDVRCRPCSKLGYSKCPKKHFKCMKNQNLDEVIVSLERSLSLSKKEATKY